MFGNYQSSENETSNYACRQTLNMYDKVCTNRLLSVAVCTWQLFFPPYAAAVVKLKKKKSKVILNFEKVDITRSLLSYTFGKLYY